MGDSGGIAILVWIAIIGIVIGLAIYAALWIVFAVELGAVGYTAFSFGKRVRITNFPNLDGLIAAGAATVLGVLVVFMVGLVLTPWRNLPDVLVGGVIAINAAALGCLIIGALVAWLFGALTSSARAVSGFFQWLFTPRE